MFPPVDQMLQVGGLPVTRSIPIGATLTGMASTPWNVTLLVSGEPS